MDINVEDAFINKEGTFSTLNMDMNTDHLNQDYASRLLGRVHRKWP